jgi:hypothetical protein
VHPVRADWEEAALPDWEEEALPDWEEAALPDWEEAALPDWEEEALPDWEEEALPDWEEEALPDWEVAALLDWEEAALPDWEVASAVAAGINGGKAHWGWPRAAMDRRAKLIDPQASSHPAIPTCPAATAERLVAVLLEPADARPALMSGILLHTKLQQERRGTQSHLFLDV